MHPNRRSPGQRSELGGVIQQIWQRAIKAACQQSSLSFAFCFFANQDFSSGDSTRILLIRKSACLWIFLFACFISTAPIKHCQLSGATFSFSKSQHSRQFKWALSDTGASMVWLKSTVFVFSLISSLEQDTSANNSRAKTISSRSDTSWSYFSMDNCLGTTCTVRTWIGQIR